MRTREMTRRQFLRGVGVCVALPALDSLLPGRSRADSGQAGKPLLRAAFLYTPNGYNQDTFVPKKTGTDWELPPALEPLAGVKEHVTLVTGLDRIFVAGTGVHAQCGACWLTSSPPAQTRDGGFPTDTTLDQLLARAVGRDTPLPSLELSCNDFADSKETKYFECVSWYGPGHAANTEKDPRAVFQRLFGRPQGDALHRSVLDAVLDDAKRLQARLGRTDREKLGEYFDSVRATERRIQQAEQATARAPASPLPEPKGIPAERGAYLRLMGDLMVLAFQQDRTRVATLVIDPERWDSPRMFHGVFDTPQNHHVLTHTKGPEAKAKLTHIDRFHVEQFAYLVERLKGIREGDGTLLDRCVVAMGSGISDGDSHNYKDLQVLLAGRAGGAIHSSRHLRYEGERPLADLWLTLLRTFGVERERFADSTGTLKELAG